MRALMLEQNEQSGGTAPACLSNITEDALPKREVCVAVEYSGLNYKDALAITGKGKIVRCFPIVPGIDFAGRVVSSHDARYQKGDKVVLTGWGVGEQYWGGMAELAWADADWLVPLPEQLTCRQAMALGTAGLTAMLCIQALSGHGCIQTDANIIVSGACGGVGSVATALLSALNVRVCALTGRVQENSAYLQSLGACKVLDRIDWIQQATKPLEKAQWSGAVDTVGGAVLAKIIAQMAAEGAVAACGLAGSADLSTTVMPFILRGVSLLGINSVTCSYERRVSAWQRLTELLPNDFYHIACHEITLEETVSAAGQLLAGQITGRLVVKVGE